MGKKIAGWALLAIGATVLIAASPMMGAGFAMVLFANELLRDA